jgi:hypothetical protein
MGNDPHWLDTRIEASGQHERVYLTPNLATKFREERKKPYNLKGETKMSNWDSTILECNNPEVVKACFKAIGGEKASSRGFKDGDRNAYFVTNSGVCHDEISAISKTFPDELITCKYLFSSEDWSQIRTVEYRDGKGLWVTVEPGYFHNEISLPHKKDQDAVCERALSFFRQLDTTREEEDGTPIIDWRMEPISFNFEYAAVDRKKYRVEAEKIFSRIDFRILEEGPNNNWVEMRHETSQCIHSFLDEEFIALELKDVEIVALTPA